MKPARRVDVFRTQGMVRVYQREEGIRVTRAFVDTDFGCYCNIAFQVKFYMDERVQSGERNHTVV